MTTPPIRPQLGPSRLEIRVTLTSGEVSQFVQDDPALVRQILDGLQPARLFSAPQLMLGGDGSLTVFPSARVERVDLVGAGLPDWPYLGGAVSVREVTAEEFQASYDPAQFAAGRRAAARAPGTTQPGYTEYGTASGSRLFWEVIVASREMRPMDFKPFIQSLFGSGGLHARTGGTTGAEPGVAVLNPAAIMRIAFHPGPPDPPLGAWHARRLR